MLSFSFRCAVAVGLALAGTASIGSASAADITGGNPVIDRPNTDGFSNFSILDRNHPITGAGVLTEWSFFAANTNAVELLIYAFDGTSYSVVGQSIPVTPTVGVNTFALDGGGIPVQAGDFVGLYFQSSGSVVYTLDPPGSNGLGGLGGTVLYTNNNSGTAGETAFLDSTNRTYSVSVTGVPEPMTVTLFGSGLALLGLLRSRGKTSPDA